MTATLTHPSKFTNSILSAAEEMLAEVLPDNAIILDPFAGTGKIHTLPWATVGVEIEPEWAALSAGTIVGDALDLPFRENEFAATFTSPCYGNRMADSHDAKDASKRNTYKHTLGRDLNENSAGTLQWGSDYRLFHEAAWKEVTRVTSQFLLLNVSDHIRKGEVMPVSAFHVQTLGNLGWEWVEARRIRTPRLREGSNYNLRVDGEWLHLFRMS